MLAHMTLDAVLMHKLFAAHVALELGGGFDLILVVGRRIIRSVCAIVVRTVFGGLVVDQVLIVCSWVMMMMMIVLVVRRLNEFDVVSRQTVNHFCCLNGCVLLMVQCLGIGVRWVFNFVRAGGPFGIVWRDVYFLCSSLIIDSRRVPGCLLWGIVITLLNLDMQLCGVDL